MNNGTISMISTLCRCFVFDLHICSGGVLTAQLDIFEERGAFPTYLTTYTEFFARWAVEVVYYRGKSPLEFGAPVSKSYIEWEQTELRYLRFHKFFRTGSMTLRTRLTQIKVPSTSHSKQKRFRFSFDNTKLNSPSSKSSTSLCSPCNSRAWPPPPETPITPEQASPPNEGSLLT